MGDLVASTAESHSDNIEEFHNNHEASHQSNIQESFIKISSNNIVPTAGDVEKNDDKVLSIIDVQTTGSREDTEKRINIRAADKVQYTDDISKVGISANTAVDVEDTGDKIRYETEDNIVRTGNTIKVTTEDNLHQSVDQMLPRTSRTPTDEATQIHQLSLSNIRTTNGTTSSSLGINKFINRWNVAKVRRCKAQVSNGQRKIKEERSTNDASDTKVCPTCQSHKGQVSLPEVYNNYTISKFLRLFKKITVKVTVSGSTPRTCTGYLSSFDMPAWVSIFESTGSKNREKEAHNIGAIGENRLKTTDINGEMELEITDFIRQNRTKNTADKEECVIYNTNAHGDEQKDKSNAADDIQTDIFGFAEVISSISTHIHGNTKPFNTKIPKNNVSRDNQIAISHFPWRIQRFGQNDSACSQTKIQEVRVCTQTYDQDVPACTKTNDQDVAASTQTKDQDVPACTNTNDQGVAASTHTNDKDFQPCTQKNDQGVPASTQTNDRDVPACTKTNDKGVPACTQTNDKDFPPCTQRNDQGVPACTQTKDQDVPAFTQTANTKVPAHTNTTFTHAPRCSQKVNSDLPGDTTISNISFHGCTPTDTTDVPRNKQPANTTIPTNTDIVSLKLQYQDLCSCVECLKDPNNPRRGFLIPIITDKLAVRDEAEAKQTLVELDTDTGVVSLVGHALEDIGKVCDQICLHCVTHDEKVKDYVENLALEFHEVFLSLRFESCHPPIAVVCSYPHGRSKTLTVGQWTERHYDRRSENSLLNYVVYKYTAPTCPGSLGAPVLVLGNMELMSALRHELQCHRDTEATGQGRSGVGLALDIT